MEFVSFEIAKKLKEKEFREKCLLHYEVTGGFYSNSIDTYDRPNQELDYSDFLKCYNDGNSIGLIDAPTISQVLKWLREKKGIHICISLGSYSDWDCEISKIDGNVYCNAYCGCHDYEQAALVGISFVIDELI